MAVSYKRIFLRWDIIRGWVPGIVFTIVAVGIELLYFTYMTAGGLADKQVSIPIGPWQLPLSIALMLSLGNVIVLLTVWMSLFENSAYVRAGPDRQIRRLLYPLRMVKVAALVLAPFTILLFGPYIILSSWFAGLMSSLSTGVPEIGSFYSWAFGISRIDPSVRFMASQLIAAFGTLVVAGLQFWRVKGTKNLAMLLRKKR